MKRRFPKGLSSGTAVAMHIKGKNSTLLKKKAVYGDDFKPGASTGRNNVDFVVQGRLDFESVSKGYTIISTNAHVYENGKNFRSSEDPIFYARYTGDRGQFGIEHARMVIFPYSGARPKEWLD